MSDYHVKQPGVTEAQFPPLPQWNIKPLKERLAEAEALRGKVSDTHVQTIRNCILGSARDCEYIQEPQDPQLPVLTIKVEDIQKIVANYFKVTVIDIISHRRTIGVVRARQVAMYLSRFLTTRSLPEIGRRFGNRDHTTILYAIRIITSILNGTHYDKRSTCKNPLDKNLHVDIDRLKNMITER